MKYKVMVEWKECGEFEVEADSHEDAINKVMDDDVTYSIGNANGEYVDDTFSVLDCVPIEE